MSATLPQAHIAVDDTEKSRAFFGCGFSSKVADFVLGERYLAAICRLPLDSPRTTVHHNLPLSS